MASLFPRQWNLYHETSYTKSSDYHIGASKDEPRFVVNFDGGLTFKSSLTIVPYHSREPTPLVRVRGDGALSRQATMEMPAVGYEAPLRCRGMLKTSAFIFDAPLDNGAGTERFEWRQSHGREVRELEHVHWGWKLVRLRQQQEEERDADTQTRLGRAARPWATTSDGQEVVAVCAENESMSLNKSLKFQFVSSGATDQLGRTWAVLAVASACRIWQVESGQE